MVFSGIKTASTYERLPFSKQELVPHCNFDVSPDTTPPCAFGVVVADFTVHVLDASHFMSFTRMHFCCDESSHAFVLHVGGHEAGICMPEMPMSAGAVNVSSCAFAVFVVDGGVILFCFLLVHVFVCLSHVVETPQKVFPAGQSGKSGHFEQLGEFPILMLQS